MLNHHATSNVLVAAVFVLGALAVVKGQAPATASKESVEGVTNFTRLDATVACAGATKATAVPELKALGFNSIVNLRRASEEGADIEGERAAAEASGVRYFHFPLPFPRRRIRLSTRP